MSGSSLDAYIDRLEASTRTISEISNSITASKPGPFTRAVLFTELGDLIREIDPSELGLFSVSNTSKAPSHDKDIHVQSDLEITRVEFHGATPLRKPQTRREEALKTKEVLPEVYAHAALKCIDRYQYVRPMPRAYSQVAVILEQLEAARERIRDLNETLKETETNEAPSLKSIVDEEEHRIELLRLKVADCVKRKEALLAEKEPHLSNKKLLAPKPPSRKPRISSPLKAFQADPDEETFWSTPAAGARTLRFSDNLLDEEADFGDSSMVSLASPTPSKGFILPAGRNHGENSRGHQLQETTVSREPILSVLDEPLETELDLEVDDATTLEPEQEQGEAGAEADVHLQTPSTPIPETVTQLSDPGPSPGRQKPSEAKKVKVKVNVEVERIVAKLWTTDLIMPGHRFDNKPPEAKLTIAHLQTISSLTPTPASPSTTISSASGGNVPPSPQQILIATLLLALLTSPQLSLPLNKVKELLFEKASTSGSAALVSSHSRVLYGCVAKRLLKIERGGGEQIVKFDI
ncbi:hypothetical protein Moror_9016 [Moniliophthora roreri MCA 2997]|uniref:Uncharacterized protein n=2 Tax=Moniliophthora roreri TaxID=221103 RepID=V2X1D8_MONRO|nr:hypothetical protein Moror_9016 [Moniliophthora roreri MCA 2997]